MRRWDLFWAAISILAVLYGAVETVLGRLPLGLPCVFIGLLLLSTVVSNRKR
jgi:hypothetical protein